jgi:hypothetical protein
MATDIRETAGADFDLLDPGVTSKIGELTDIAKSVFGCDPIVCIEADHEIPDEHYLLFRVDVVGDIPDIRKKQDEWYRRTAAILGRLVTQIRLLIAVA